MKKLTIQRVKHVHLEPLAKLLKCRLSATKMNGFVVLTKENGDFSIDDATKVAEHLGMRYNGKVIL